MTFGLDQSMDAIQLTGIQPSDAAMGGGTAAGFPSFEADVTLHMDLAEAGASGDITTTVDYEQIARRVASALKAGSHDLIESVAQSVADAVLLSHRVYDVEVTVRQHRHISGVSLGEVAVVVNRANAGSDPASEDAAYADTRLPESGKAPTAASVASAELSGPARSVRGDDPGMRMPGDGRHDEEGAQETLRKAERHTAVIAMSGGDRSVAEGAFRTAIVMLDGVPGSQVVGISPLYSYDADAASDSVRTSAVVIVECVAGRQELLSIMRSIEFAQGRGTRGKASVDPAALGDAGDEEVPTNQHAALALLRYDEESALTGERQGHGDRSSIHPEVLVAWHELDEETWDHQTTSSLSEDELNHAERYARVNRISDEWILGGMS